MLICFAVFLQSCSFSAAVGTLESFVSALPYAVCEGSGTVSDCINSVCDVTTATCGKSGDSEKSGKPCRALRLHIFAV